MRGRRGPPESLARGTLTKGFSRNLGKPRSLLWQESGGKPAAEGNQRPKAMGCEESYEPILPMKMGNRRATEEVAATGPIGGKGRTKRTDRMRET